MATTQIDGQFFKNLVISGAVQVISTQEELNKINVFPVADGDTGSNMAAAFESILLDIHHLESKDLEEVADHVAEAGLNGSRGNSGAILAQFFTGIANNVLKHTSIGIEKFAESMMAGSSAAHDAISNPVEGTIITVMHDWAEWLGKHWSQHQTFESLSKKSLGVAKAALKRTPKQLKVLADNHVVDAGAQGFVNFLDGMDQYLQTKELPDIEKITSDAMQEVTGQAETINETDSNIHLTGHVVHGDQDINFQYCTECIIYGHPLNTSKIRESLSSWGDSMVIVGGKNKAKIHIHTNDPSHVFRMANQFGEILESKAEDMWAQYRARIQFHLNKSITLVSDSSCNLPQELLVKYNIVLIPLQIIVNNQTYLDRINITNEQFCDFLKSDKNTITTSQPKAKDTENAFNKALQLSPMAIGIFLSGKLSGSFDNIKQTASQYDVDEVSVFDSKNLSAGLALVVLQAAKAIQAGKPASTVKKVIEDSIANCKSYVSLATLKYAIRGGRVKKSAGTIARILRLLPILENDQFGKIKKAAVTFGLRANRRKMLKLALKHADQFKDCEFLIAHGRAKKDAQSIQKKILKKHPGKTIDFVEVSPVLLTHAGLGSIAISVMGID